MSKSIKKPAYIVLKYGHVGYVTECSYNLEKLTILQFMIRDIRKSHDEKENLELSAVFGAYLTEAEADERNLVYYQRNIIFPPNWTDEQLKDFALANSETLRYRCGDAC